MASFSPAAQFLFGCFMMQYRQNTAELQIDTDTAGKIDESLVNVGPFSEYGAQLQEMILLIQIGAFAVLMIIILIACSREIVPPELDGDLDPIDDDFSVTKEAEEEKERVS